MSDDSPSPAIADRIERLIDVLSLLALGEYDPALAHIEVGPPNSQLSVLEQALVLFVRELVEAREENRAYVAALEHNQRDIELKLSTIERQQQAIRELGTPVVELWDDILMLPIVGSVDSQRATDMTEMLLRSIVAARAKYVIIDLTGLATIDTMTANAFMQMVRAAGLLGTHCVLTGLSPQTAQTLVTLGVEINAIPTLRSLKQGLEYCLLHRRQPA